MGNPNQRSGNLARPQPAQRAQQPSLEQPSQQAQKPSPEPQPPRCTSDACRVLNYHLDKTYDVGDRDLPDIIMVKHIALSEALTAGKFVEARISRKFLECFYAHHGPADGSALLALPQIPEKPKQCKHTNCPVVKYHHENTFETDSQDLPYIVKDNQKRFSEALTDGDYGRAVASRGFLEKFFAVHGPSVLPQLPALPPHPKRCENKLCPVPAWHADKVYKADAKDLPRLVKQWTAKTWEIDSQMGDWVGSSEQKKLNEFWSVHGGVAKK